MRRAWAEGKFAGRHARVRADTWSLREKERLAQLAGKLEPEEIARKLTEEFGIARTATAVKIKMVRSGLSRWPCAFTLRDVERLFRVDHRVILRWWIRPGLLTARRRAICRGPSDGWLIEQADVERFIRTHRYAYVPARMAPGDRLAQLAEMLNRKDPWLSRAELAQYLGIGVDKVSRWLARGLVPHERRYGAGGIGEVRVRASDFPSIAEAIRAAQQRARQQSARRLRDARSASSCAMAHLETAAA